MQELVHIEVGQQDNDGKGDLLRRGMTKVNANFTKVQAGVDAVELTAANAAQTATEAKATADAAIPATQKGMAGGVAPLDASGKVPATHLPELADYIPVEEKGAAGGVAPLDAGSKVPVANLPAGTAGGVAPLGADGKVPAINLPAAEDSIPLSQKGQPGGVATLDTGGKVPAGQLPPIPTGPPAGSVAWWPLRSSIPAGQIPADGQTISRATFPDLVAMVVAGTVPVATESDWLADPRNRGCYTAGDGSTTIRVPDLNGRSSGTLGRIFLSGDGADSNGVWGVIQRDQFQKHQHYINIKTGSSGSTAYGTSAFGSGADSQYSTVNDAIRFDSAAGDPRTGNKTHPQNVAGVWTIQAFGAVTNPGSADAAQLASDYAVLNAGFQTLSAAFQTVRGQAFGVGQSMQNVAGSRTIGVAYTNTTGRPIVVYISGDTNTSAGGNLGITIGGLFVARSIWASQGIALAVTAVIPPGIAYVANASGISLSQWQEYR